ncbi:class E sortase [Kineococcus rhizosphaerae]|uniref:Sortase A n=1 Tax=Kineococcus rhizosphaerae TaxID=559628 RepID=A0A2T0QYF1_9ACTN|nr:class E sortase [Kineococcus rhizosphaerae]PRY11405.1 sortase A [Kineococcus rhizosphaerae]
MIRRTTSVLGELLLTAGVLTLLFVVWQLYWTDLTSGKVQAATVSSLEQRWGPSTPAPTAPATQPVADPPVDPVAVPALGDPFAIVYVPRFGGDYAVPVVEGTGTEELKDGIGHYVQSVMPGQVGNFAIAGHRVTYGKPFNRIAELQDGDAVVVATATQWLTYRVRSHEIVSPQQVSVIAPVPDQPGVTPTQAWLTMTACHPMHSARQRYVVHAQLESVRDRSDGEPPSLAPVGD